MAEVVQTQQMSIKTSPISKRPRHNNFDIIRLVAAWLIMFGHSFTFYDRSKDILVSNFAYDKITNFALAGFFVISGYLVTASFISNPHFKTFAIKRALRILPALCVVIILTILVLGPIVTSLPISEYFAHSETYKYLRGILIFPLEYYLPGVFEDLPYAGVVNGSLWSLELEVKCYLIVAAFGLIGLLKPKWIGAFSLACLLTFLLCMVFEPLPKRVLGIKSANIVTHSHWYFMFFAGAALYMFRQHVSYRFSYFALALIFSLISWYFIPQGKVLHMLMLPYLILYLALGTKPISGILKGHDISYGVYLYACPIQQAYMHYIGQDMGYLSFLVSTTVITFLFGYLSWNLVEKPCLNYKRKLVK